MQKNIPRYSADPLLRFLDYWTESMRLLHLGMQGISMLRGMPRIIEVLNETSPLTKAEEALQSKPIMSLERAKEAADFAHKECNSGFPLLHAHTLVGAWGALEAAIEDMVVGMLTNEPELLQQECFAKVRIPLASFQLLDKDERIRLLIAEMQRSQGLSKKHGVEMFESLFESVGLTGSLDPNVKKDMWEVHHLRNVIVHRGAIADRRLIQNCPWLGLQVGKRITITHEALSRYGDAMGNYALAIAHRLCDRYRVDAEARLHNSESETADTDAGPPVVGDPEREIRELGPDGTL